jgi:hypothetical protein
VAYTKTGPSLWWYHQQGIAENWLYFMAQKASNRSFQNPTIFA